jgi:hypothetical protein
MEFWNKFGQVSSMKIVHHREGILWEILLLDSNLFEMRIETSFSVTFLNMIITVVWTFGLSGNDSDLYSGGLLEFGPEHRLSLVFSWTANMVDLHEAGSFFRSWQSHNWSRSWPPFMGPWDSLPFAQEPNTIPYLEPGDWSTSHFFSMHFNI